MSDGSMIFIEGDGLDQAWSRAFLTIKSFRSHEASPLFLSIRETNDPHQELAPTLDAFLSLESKNKMVYTVANTIFPQSIWEHSFGDRNRLFARYRRSYQRTRDIEPLNRRGTYFGRLVEELPQCPEGQLENIISMYRADPHIVRMRLQASIFDAARDHKTGARPSFPCMQHVSFAPHNDTLDVNAFYASQLVLQKAYGNYLGLQRLGRFMAEQMNLRLRAVNVLSGIAKVTDLKPRSAEMIRLVQAAKQEANR